MSSTPMILPDPYAYVLRGDEYFGLNVHLIDLRGVVEEDVQRCVQCECQYLNQIRFGGNGENSEYINVGGGAQCCYGGMRCASTLPDDDRKQYYFKYKIVYESFDPRKHKPVYSSVFSASSDSSAVCHVEFNPPVCTRGDHGEGPDSDHTEGRCLDEDTAIIEYKWQVNSDIDIIYSWGHGTGFIAIAQASPIYIYIYIYETHNLKLHLANGICECVCVSPCVFPFHGRYIWKT